MEEQIGLFTSINCLKGHKRRIETKIGNIYSAGCLTARNGNEEAQRTPWLFSHGILMACGGWGGGGGERDALDTSEMMAYLSLPLGSINHTSAL